MTVAIITVGILLALGLALWFTAVGIKRSEPNKYITAGKKALKATSCAQASEIAISEVAADVVGESVDITEVAEVSKVKSGLVKLKNWWIAHRPSKRRLIQLYCAVLYNANIKGFISGEIYTSETTKYMCVPGLNCYSCPGAVGACPMGALQNGLAESGTRAPYYVLGILAIFGIMFARTVCGFLCPIGLGQELLYKARTPKVKKSRVTRALSYLKYVILALAIALPLIYGAFDIPLPAFCKYICPAGTLGGAVMLLINPNNAGLFGQLGWQFTWKFCLAIGFVVSSVFIYRVFCRFFCPLGAIYGFFNRYALIGVTVDKRSCTDCGLCVAHCKMDVKRVGDHECINCGECMSVCPTKAISWKGSKMFLHADASAEIAPTVKPLAVENGTVRIASDNGGAIDIPRDEFVAQATDIANRATFDTATAVEKFEPSAPVKAKKKPKKSAKFILEATAWILALALLVTALVCYNFVDVKDTYVPTPDPDGTVTGYNVGDVAPDFTVQLYGGEGGQFKLYDNRGKITVINFWATWCTPCVTEIPYFNHLAEDFENINVIAIHGSSSADVQKYIDRKYSIEPDGSRSYWRDYALTFAQDNIKNSQCLTYKMFGGKDEWPRTIIVDGEGKVIYNASSSFESYEDLKQTVTELIQ